MTKKIIIKWHGSWYEIFNITGFNARIGFPFLPNSVWVNAIDLQSTSSIALRWVTAPNNSMGTPTTEITSSLRIRFVKTKFWVVLEA